MAHKQDDSMAVADVYAASLLNAVDARERIMSVADELAELVAYMDRSPEFDRFLTAEAVDAEQRRETLEKLFRGKMDDLLLNLLQVMNRRGRMLLVRPLARCVQLRIEALQDQQEVIVETASPLTDELRARLKKEMTERVAREALIVEQVRPELIGGMIIRIGDQQIDASIASRLQRMSRRLRDQATVEIHAGRGIERAG